MRGIHVIVLILCWGALARPAIADDWPMYGADAARRGYTDATPPDRLSLAWNCWTRHAPSPAWVGRSLARSRMTFDWSAGVVAADGLCFFGSSVRADQPLGGVLHLV